MTEQNENISGRSEEDDDRMHRRGFFRQGLRHFLKPLAEMVEQRVQHLEVPNWVDEDGQQPRPPSTGAGTRYLSSSGKALLRPPGAVPEEEFLERCVGSGGCVQACPVSAIHLLNDDDATLQNKPVIDPDLQACVICDDLACMHACPTGALQLVPAERIEMGKARVDPEVCIRSQGEDCEICVDKCPIGPAAIDIPEYGGEVAVNASGCTGCGVCQMYCPTAPKAIVVDPRVD